MLVSRSKLSHRGWVKGYAKSLRTPNIRNPYKQGDCTRERGDKHYTGRPSLAAGVLDC